MKQFPILSLMCAGLLLTGGALRADDSAEPADAPKPNDRPPMRQNAPLPPENRNRDNLTPPPPRRGQDGPGMGRMGRLMRNSDPGMLVKDELKTYLSDKSDANYRKLESALQSAMTKDTERRREMLKKQIEHLQKELTDLEANQQKRAGDFLDKVKSGEYKPQAPRQGGRQRGGAPRDNQGGMNQANR